jgi:NADPH2:quinone reductase
LNHFWSIVVKAAWYECVGAACDVLQLGEMPDPQPGPGQVRVRLQWSGVNPSDVKSRGGVRSQTLPFARIVPHSDGAGVIDAVGEGVNAARLGERVWTWNAGWGRPFGTAAQFVCLPEAQAVYLPEATSGEAGACLGIPALTALHAVLVDGGVAGKTVLVQGGAGAVGHYAVQFAARLGARRVIATVSTPHKAELARAAGADDVIFYKSEPVAERARQLAGGQGVDRIIEMDLAGNAAADFEALRPDGELVVYGSAASPLTLPFFPLISKNIGLKFFIVYNLAADDRARAHAVLQRMLARGELAHNIAERLPLSEIARGHELIEQGQVGGNLVLKVD